MEDAFEEYVAWKKREQRLWEYNQANPIDPEEVESPTEPEEADGAADPEEARVPVHPAEYTRPCPGMSTLMTLLSYREPISPFQIIPAEIRIKIFKLLLLPPTEPLNLDHPRNYTNDFMRCRYRLPWQPTALFLLDKQTYTEAAAIYYSKNQIRLRDPLAMGEFMSAIGKRSRPNLRSIVVVMTTMVDVSESWGSLQFCEGLETLVLEIGHKTFDGQPLARNSFKQLKGLPSLLKVRGLKEVDVKMIAGRVGMSTEKEVAWRAKFLDALQVLKEKRKAVVKRRNKRSHRGEEDVENGEAEEGKGNQSDSTLDGIAVAQPVLKKRAVRATRARKCKGK